MVVRMSKGHIFKPEKPRKGDEKPSPRILARCQGCRTYRESQEAHEWTEEICRHAEALLAENHAQVATGAERARYEHLWTISLNRHGSNTASRQSRADHLAAVGQICDVKKEAVHSVRGNKITLKRNPTLRARRRPVARSAGQGSSWDSWWSSSFDSYGGQHGKNGTPRGL